MVIAILSHTCPPCAGETCVVVDIVFHSRFAPKCCESSRRRRRQLNIMATKQMDNSAMVDRLQKVGKVLQHSEVKTLRSRIDEWLDTNDELLGKLLLFLESGMVTEMLSGQTGRKLPKSCTRVELLSAAVRCQSLYKANSSFTPSLIRLAKKKDKNIIDNMFSLGASFPTGMAMKGGLPISEWFQAWSERNQILGSRLQHVSVGSDGAVDWMACGVYFFCRVSDSSGVEAGGVEQMCGGEIKHATHVLRRASGMAVSLADLGIPKVEAGWFSTRIGPRSPAACRTGSASR